ncbi:MarR family winged helix-turn-helix transcriptional regulator [Actinomadura rubrisoli]|uniref:MarR family transcriptional regulator n=1 Tax=Actinomadura rubrisoli TaxID=2530368 RepID=A0A4R4ZYU4_9ACTN|nr:MarR family transcriptional regulator [Actinomadura rubrisoli]TDD63840.1 MarR family transcriptional regulator [Actinomadura rubrisoli]
MENLGFGDLAALGPVEEWPVGRLFAVASRLSGPVVWRIIERHGVSPAGFFTLRLLLFEDGLRAGEIAKRLLIAPATVTSVVDTLERNGLVERRRSDEDRRAVLVHVTDAGRGLIRDKGKPIAEDLFQLYDVVEEGDEPAVRRFLVNLIKRFEDFPEAKGCGA